MEEAIPPDIDGSPSGDAEKTNQHAGENPVTDSQPNINVIEARTPQKITVTECTPQPPSHRKYRLLYEDMRARFNELKNDCDKQMMAFEEKIAEKDSTIKDLKQQIKNPCVMKMNNEDPFVSKPRKNAKGEAESNGCKVTGCENINVDLIKCSMCGNLVCEDCSGVKVTKLRPIMNACSKLYFTCPTCDLLVKDTNDVNVIDKLKGKIDALKEQLTSCKRENSNLDEDVEKYLTENQELRAKITNLEKDKSEQEMQIKMQGGVIQRIQSKDLPSNEGAVIQNTDIDAKLDAFSANILSKVAELMDHKIGTINAAANPAQSSDNADPPTTTWSNMVSKPQDMKIVMREARNDEKLEESEKQRRANNIIIHGAEEIGATPVESKSNDAEYIKEILAKIGVEVAPASISRLGAPRENGMRPIKLVLKSGEDKEKVMRNLGKLKNTERYFGKISLKDDHTANEREQIRKLTSEAKKKCEEDPDRDFKVRGDSKNGWRIVSFPKK